jgi:hypothetical protein
MVKGATMPFDISTFATATTRLAVDDLDIEGEFRARPLDADSLRCLRYMHDVEHHTVCYLRDLLVTRAHRDPRLTTFLTCWAYEEHWHGDAIGRVLAAHGTVANDPRVEQARTARGWTDYTRPIGFIALSAVMRSFGALHMTWGAVNEWTTQAGYARLIAKARHPGLTELLRRIMRQEGRHIDVYSSEARRRLAESRPAQRITRFALRKVWGPVGTGVVADDEVRFLVTHLFGDDDGLGVVRRLDRRIDSLPGLGGLGLLERARLRYAV